MGKWQDEYEREWESFTRETLRTRFGRAYTRHRVTTSDKRELRDLLRSMGSTFDPFTVPTDPPNLAIPSAPLPTTRTRRSSVVRFQTPSRRRMSMMRPLDDTDADLTFPATQILPCTQDEDHEEESGGNTSDTSMQSDVSYVYQTPQPKIRNSIGRRVRQRSPAAAVSSVERQQKRRVHGSLARSSTSTFPTFSPQDLQTSRDQLNTTRLLVGTSQTLQRRMACMSPITAARLRFSIESALNDSRTTTDESDVLYAVETMETQTCRDAGDTKQTPQPIPPRRVVATREAEKVVDLNESMQSMHLEEGEDENDVIMSSGTKVDAERGHDSHENDEEDGRKIAAMLDFKGMSDDEDDDEEPRSVVATKDQLQRQQAPVTTNRWYWSETTMQGESESMESITHDIPQPKPQAKPAISSEADVPPTKAQDIIEIDDSVIPEPEVDENVFPEPEADDMIPEPEAEEADATRFEDDEMCGETEAVNQMYSEPQATETAAEEGNPMSNMLKNRLRNVGLAMSDEENGKELDPFDSSIVSATKGSPTASSSSASSSTSKPTTRSLYYRTKLPLAVESTIINVGDRRRERRQKLKKKLASLPYVATIPECNVELAPYQREAVDWMLKREEPHLPAENDGRSPSTARQRDMYYDRLTAKMRGGILADEMGLGKTICCIALICESLKKFRGEQSSELSSSLGSNSEGIPRLKAPTLIITPLSILGQWENEIREKTNLSVISYQGHSRRQIQNVMDFMGVDLVFTTKKKKKMKECKVAKGTRRHESVDSVDDDNSDDASAIVDQLNDSRQWRTAARRLSNSNKPTAGSKLHQLMWHRVILDESHLITNPSCARAKAALILKSKRRWCVTGTPIQNSGKDLSSLMTFLGMSHVAADLDYHEVLSRVMLRRLKSTVDMESNEPIVQLPDKQEEILELEFASDLEKAYYTLLHRSTKRRVFEYLKKLGHGTGGQFMHVFELLLRLRQCCDACSLISDDPKGGIQDGNGALLAEIGTLTRQEAALLERASKTQQNPKTAKFSTKITVLLRELRTMKQNRERGLVVSQWTSFLDLIGEAIQDENSRDPSEERNGTILRFCRLDGRMSAREREQAIASFQVEKRVDIMLVSIRTGGLGLNLTAASQVFIMEPSWNPSIESQAIDRAHRVGQKQRVRIVRFLMKNTIEERVVELQRKKRELAITTLGDGIVSSQGQTTSTKESALSRDELRGLFSQDREVSVDEPDDSMEGAIWDELE